MLNFCDIFSHPIYIVGGCVRDRLLGIEIKDIDIASDLEPKQFKILCRKLGIRTADTGIEHGTVTAIIDGVPYEHTTFREDVSNDGRNATIKFSKTIEEDLSRRDFTINAIAMLGDEIIDPFNGRKDLDSKILKTVGDPYERFSEDYLRIVRAARFQARLGLSLAPGLLEATKKLSKHISTHVSVERITDELNKAQKHGSQFIECAKNLGFLKYILPHSQNLSVHDYKDWLSEITKSESLNTLQFFAALLLPICENDVDTLARKLKLNNQISKGLLLFKKHDNALNQEKISAAKLRRLKIQLKGYFDDYYQRISLVRNSTELESSNLSDITDLNNSVDISITSPFFTGSFLKKENLKPGPYFKTILDTAGELQAEGKTQQEILEKIQVLIKRHKT
jgi:tRNA nucleotidyltransferase (CCA-adding enzyme)